MLIESVVLASILIFVSGTGKAILEKTSIKMLWMPILAFFLESVAKTLVAQSVEGKGWLEPSVVGLVTTPFWIELVVYGLLLTFIAINYKQYGFKLLWLGMGMNALVILVNGGMMPVDTDGIRTLGYAGTASYLESGAVFAHNAIGEATQLRFLADIWHITPPYPFPKSVSPGDLVMDLGILMYAIRTVAAERKLKSLQKTMA